MARYAILLRGINLGRARRVAMADFRTVLTQSGYENVATLLRWASAPVRSGADAHRGGLRRTTHAVAVARPAPPGPGRARTRVPARPG
ncbi:DUF1697 domain-containing protein [Micromonospora sp. NPDC048935]|uniref:DUF1697 domain-containing protein n=1 Tax=Micromonospora sp. NPDC048935 TaxID=3364262 RepID=UPI00371E09DB